MAFMGNVPQASRVDVQLALGGQAKGTALLALSFADNGGGSGAASVTVAPGGTAALDLTTGQENGRLLVVVDCKEASDPGELIVRVNGAERDRQSVSGDTTWAYSIS